MVAEPPAESASPAGGRPPRDPSGVEQAYFSVVAAIGDVDPGVFAPEEECYPSTGVALRGALDAGIVAAVAGGAWIWHLRRSRPRTAKVPAAT